MHFDTGHGRYCLEETAARLGIDRATVKRRVRQLREAGLLAFVVHGARTNIRRILGAPGYAGTATIYAAVIPPAYDDALGHIRVGTGYTTRIIVPASDGATPVAPPSLSVVKEVGSLEVDGGLEDTSRKRASRQQPPIPRQASTKKRSNGQGAGRRSPLQVAQDCR